MRPVIIGAALGFAAHMLQAASFGRYCSVLFQQTPQPTCGRHWSWGIASGAVWDGDCWR